MRKLLSILLTLSLLVSVLPPVAQADNNIRQSLNQYIEENYGSIPVKDFFPETVNGKPFNIIEVNEIKDSSGNVIKDISGKGISLKIPNYGEPFDFTQKFGMYRYAGYTPQGLPNGAPNHPFDEWGGGILETRKWMDNPWENDGVKKKIASQLGVSVDDVDEMFPVELSLAVRNIPQIREKILWGLLLNQYNGEYIFGEGPGLGINYPWEKKIMVFYPPTPETWGRGCMWHYSGGTLWYCYLWIPNKIPDAAPDFYPTPKDSTEWQPSYKDANQCAEIYYYEPGQTEIAFPVNLYNQGEEAITDFKAVWFGKGDDPVKGWQEN
ncbi:MAG TPA: hypothetical protein GXX58_10960 [Gelria sp.]|jgi:hypothetical protein|nr:hypothetical protein [Gelria sp.]